MKTSTRSKTIATAVVFWLTEGEQAPESFVETLKDLLDGVGFSYRIYKGTREDLYNLVFREVLAFVQKQKKRPLYVVTIADDVEFCETIQEVTSELLREKATYLRHVLLSPTELMVTQEEPRKFIMSKLIEANKEPQDIEESYSGLRFVDDWAIGPNGMYARGKKELLQISRFVALIKKEIRVTYPEAGESETILQLELSQGDKKETIEISASKLHNVNFWLPPRFFLCDIPRVSERLAHCIKAVSYRLYNVEKQTLYGTTGWVYEEGTGHVFITPKSPLFYSSGAVLPYEVLTEEEIASINKSNLKETLHAFLKCHTKNATYGLLASAAVGPLLPHFLKVSAVDFGTALLGPTGVGKTTMARLLLCFYGKDFVSSSILTWEGTSAALENYLSIYSSLPLAFDDWRPPASMWEQRSLNEKLQLVTRLYSQRFGKVRATAGGGLRKAKPIHSYLIITGEYALVNVASVRNRFLALQVEPGHAQWDLISRLQESSHLLNALGSLYIHSIGKELNRSKEEFVEKLRSLWKRAYDSSPSVEQRLKGAFATLVTALTSFVSSLYEAGVLEEAEAQIIAEEGHEILYRAIEEHQKSVTKANPVNRFLEALKELISIGRVVYLKDGDHLSDRWVGSKPVIWSLQPKEPYVAVPTGILGFVQEYINRKHEPPLLKDQFLGELKSFLGGGKIKHRRRRPWDGEREYVWLLPVSLLEDEEDA